MVSQNIESALYFVAGRNFNELHFLQLHEKTLLKQLKMATTDIQLKVDDETKEADNVPTTVEEELDHKKCGWFHVKICIISGAGFFTDAYDLFSVGLVTS